MFEINVFIKNFAGFFSYEVKTMDQVLSHLGAIVNSGYRRVDERQQLVWYPPHMIYCVKAKGPGLDTKYPDKVVRT